MVGENQTNRGFAQCLNGIGSVGGIDNQKAIIFKNLLSQMKLDLIIIDTKDQWLATFFGRRCPNRFSNLAPMPPGLNSLPLGRRAGSGQGKVEFLPGRKLATQFLLQQAHVLV